MVKTGHPSVSLLLSLKKSSLGTAEGSIRVLLKLGSSHFHFCGRLKLAMVTMVLLLLVASTEWSGPKRALETPMVFLILVHMVVRLNVLSAKASFVVFLLIWTSLKQQKKLSLRQVITMKIRKSKKKRLLLSRLV